LNSTAAISKTVSKPLAWEKP